MALLAEIQATCSALGYLEGDKYVKETDCLESVKDLIRYLKREDDTCDIRRLLGEAQIVQNDLIPLLKASLQDSVLLDTVVRLLVNLTQPALLCFQGYIPTEKTQHNFYLQVLGHLGEYKQAFANQSLFQSLCQKLGDLLQLEWEARQEEDRLLIERILILIRNILHISPLEDERRTDDDASIHDQVLWALHTSGMEDLLLFIASSDEERQFAIHILEIISLMFREQNADQLARAGAGRTMTEKEKDEHELIQSRQREKVQKRIAAAKYSTRHSRFGGTYVLANVKSISDNAMIYHRSQGDVKNISFDQGKKPKKLGKNRKPILEDSTCRRSTLSIRLAMKHFCMQFLENCYNPLMNCVKDRLQHDQTEENDETYYIWAMRFFMEFQRYHKFKVDVISETLNSNSFHYIHVQIMKYSDMMLTNKNEATVWGKRMHLALKAYKELLLTVNAMDKGTEAIRESGKVLKSNIFYVPEYKDLVLMLLMKFKQSKQSRSFLKDLIETTHIFLKMLESYCSGSNNIMVQNKKKKKKKKKPKKTRAPPQENSETTQEELEERWDAISSDLSSMIQGHEEVPEIVSPFDAASEVDVDQQKDDAMFRIHDALRQQRAGEALALLRAARQVWPDQEIFGPEEMSGESEFMAVRQIFFTNLNRGQENSEQVPEEEEHEESDDEEERERWMSSEAKFEFKDYLTKFIRPDILKPYVLLLSEYNRNSPQMNHYLVKMLHRIAVDCKVPGMLFQMSLFRVFQKVLMDPVAKVSHKELQKFAHFVIIKFFEMDNKDAFHEILFWKNVRESLELIDGFGTYQGEKAKSSGWNEEEEMELQRLYEDLKDREDPELDVVDLIMKEIINESRTRRQIIVKLAQMDLITSAKDIKKKKKPNRAKMWLEEDESQLQGLFHEHKHDPDVLNHIMNHLQIKRSKNAVIDKLIGMNLIQDRSEVTKRKKGRKKKEEDLERPPKSKEFISSGEDDSDREERAPKSKEFISSSDDDSDRARAKKTNSDSESDNEIDKEIQKQKQQKRKPKGRGRKDDSSDDDDAFLKFINKNKKSEPKAPKGNMDTHVKKILEKGLQADLDWIVTTFKDEAADREEEAADDATPIVPLSEVNSSALENAAFKAVLKLLGARPPADEQERYWRIPEYFTPGMLRERVSNIEKALEKARKPPSEPDERSDKENQTPKPVQRLNKRQMSESSSGDDDPLRLVLDETQESSPVKSPPSKRSRLDSEDSQTSSTRKTKSQPKKKALESSDDDEPLSQTQKSTISAKSSQSSRSSSPSLSTQRSSRNSSQKSTQNSPEKSTQNSTQSSAANSTQNSPEKSSQKSNQSSPEKASQKAKMSEKDENRFAKLDSSDSDSDVEDRIPLRKVVRRAMIGSDSE